MNGDDKINLEENSHHNISNTKPNRLIKQDMAHLPSSCLVLKQGIFSVYLAESIKIPNILNEIGYLRLNAFNLSSNNQNNLGLDELDFEQLHMFVVNTETDEIAGAYRLGLTDIVLKKTGKSGLLVTSLYDISDDFFDLIGPAIEMSRTFIVEKYRKNPLVLGLLWKGIVRSFISNNQQYHSIYGLISLSNQYAEVSHKYMAYFLRQHHYDERLATHVKAKFPYEISTELPHDIKQIIEQNNLIKLNQLIKEIELDGKGIPILLKQYLGMNTKIVQFGWDPNFNAALDCFSVSFIKNMPIQKLKHLMGMENWETYRGINGY